MSTETSTRPLQAEIACSPRIRRIQRTALVLLVTGGVINYIDRSTLAIGLPLIREELGFNFAESGLLLSAFLWAYAFSQLPAGALVDRLGSRLMLASALGLWSLAQGLGGLVRSFWQFVSVRVLLGLGEAPQFPTCARVVSDWFHRRERGTATGIWNCSSSLGQAVAAPVLTILMLNFGWRWMFGIMGIAGLAIAAAAYAIHRDPNQVDLTPAEKEYLQEDAKAAPRVTWAQWRSLFGFGTVWGMILGFFGAMYVLWVYNSWLPQYLEHEWHFSIAKTGWFAAVPYVFGVIGSLTGGRVCDMLVHKGFTPLQSRKIPVIAGLLGISLFTFLTANAGSPTQAIVYISISLFMIYIVSAAAWAMASVATSSALTASVGSIQNFGGYLGGALAPASTGFMIQATGSFKSALYVGVGITIFSAIAHFFLVRQPAIPKGE